MMSRIILKKNVEKLDFAPYYLYEFFLLTFVLFLMHPTNQNNILHHMRHNFCFTVSVSRGIH